MSVKEGHSKMLVQQPLQRETLGSQIYRALRTAILEQTYKGGERLTQEELASNFGTSRIPVRDALRKLETDGLVTAEGSGYSVVQFGPDDVMEVYAIRALLEPYAARKATANIDEEQLEAVRALTTRMAEAMRDGDFEQLTHENSELHMTLYEASNMPRLVRMIESLWSGRPPLTPLQVPEQAERSVKEHEELLSALTARDGERVAGLLEAHILNARDALLNHYARESKVDA